MKKFTNEKRAEIYFDAAMLVDERHFGCCNAIAKVAKLKYPIDFDNVMPDLFDEIWQFKPKNYKKLAFWWRNTSDKNNQNCRVIALLLSHQMAKNP